MIPTGIKSHGEIGTPLLIPNIINKLVITIKPNITIQTATNIQEGIWLIKIIHPYYLAKMTNDFKKMDCTTIILNFSHTVVEEQYKINLPKNLPLSVEEIIIMNDTCEYYDKFENFPNLKRMILQNCFNIKAMYTTVFKTKLEELILKNCSKLFDEHYFSNSIINLRVFDEEICSEVECKEKSRATKHKLLPPIQNKKEVCRADQDYDYWKKVNRKITNDRFW